VTKEEADCEGDERTGVKIVEGALEAPAPQIAGHSGADASVVVGKVRDGTDNIGFDAARGEFVDLCKAGIIDPMKVVRVALENAASVASTLLLTEATVTERPESRPEPAGAGALSEV
jgi:chaperonin GroEL